MDNPTAATEQSGSTRPSNTGAHRRPSRRWAASSMAALTVATLVAVGCVADPGPTAGAALTAATSTVGVVDGSVVRVSGRGYNPAANIGTRPPLFAQPAGVYAIFACVSDPWRPSQGATGSSRQIIQQFWAVPGQAQFDAIGGAAAGAVLMGADGSFDVDVTLTAAPCTGRYAVITFPGSGAAANPGEENEIPVTFAAPA